MTVIAMSRTEIDRMSVLQDLAAGRIKVAAAATLMGYHHRGPAAQVSRVARLRGFTRRPLKRQNSTPNPRKGG